MLAAGSAPPSATPAPTPTFRRLFELAAGGMATVDVVLRDEGHFRRLFAQKRMHRHLQQDRELRAMFLDEARLAGLLRHPNVVSVLDVGEDEDGPFLVMPYVSGIALGAMLDEMRAAIRGDFARLAERRGGQELLRVSEAETREPVEEPDEEARRPRSWLARLLSP